MLLAVVLAANHWLAPAPRAKAYVVRIELPPAGGEIGLPAIQGPLDASRPLVVIDAGHGGHDPGAIGRVGTHEKDVRVALTRDDDHFLALPERSGIARRLKADLFIAIHADSAAGEGADMAKGGTVYTLSQKGSDEEASRLAQSENAADQVNGVPLKSAGSDVGAILVDVSQHQSAQQSEELARLILREGQGRITFRARPIQSAAFVVLKSPDVASVLFEAGYISNRDDAARLNSAAGRKAFADVSAQAIRVWFARQTVPQPPVAAITAAH